MINILSYASSTDSIIIHNKTEGFIDVESPVEMLKIDSSGDIKADFCIMAFDIFNGKEVYHFFYRRPYTIKQCKKEEQEYQKMLKAAKTVRVVGISPDETQEATPSFKKKYGYKTPSKELIKWTKSFFARLQVEKKCKAFFVTDCDLPKNYWANTIPPKQK